MTARGAFDIWVTSTELPSLIAAFPELGLLVRGGCGRGLMPAREVPAYIERIQAEGDYVRDVGFAVDTTAPAVLTQLRKTGLVPVQAYLDSPADFTLTRGW